MSLWTVPHTSLLTDSSLPLQEAKLLVAKAYRHTEKVLLDNLDKLQAVRACGPGIPKVSLEPRSVGDSVVNTDTPY